MRKNPVRNKKMRKKLMAGAVAVTMATAMGTTALVPMENIFADTITATNISFGTARELNFNTSNAEEMSEDDDARFYKFSVDEASIMVISCSSDDGYKKCFTVYDENCTLVYQYDENYNFTTSNIYLTGGSYYLKLNSSRNVSFMATIDSLKETFTETQTENNDNHDDADTISLSKKYKGVLAQNDEKDYYKFELAAAGKVNVNVTNSTNDDLKAVIYDDSNAMVYNKSIGSGKKIDEEATLASGTYYFMVTQQDVGYGVGSYAFNLDFVMSTPTISSLKNSAGKKMTVKWADVDGADGYELQYSKMGNFKSGVTQKTIGATINSASYSKLTKGKTYYVRIRSYVDVNGTKKYSGWSKKSVVIKK